MIKKTASILLIITMVTSLFINAIDYYMVASYIKEQKWIASKKNTANSKFKVIKLNATLYSFIEDSELKSVDENFVIDDKVYHIFKKCIKDNIINLYYLSNENQTCIDISLKKNLDSQSSSNKLPLKDYFKALHKYYVMNVFDNSIFILKPAINKTLISDNYNNKLLSGYSQQNFLPPKNDFYFFNLTNA